VCACVFGRVGRQWRRKRIERTFAERTQPQEPNTYPQWYLPLVDVGNCLIKTRQQNMSHASYTASRDIGTRNPPQAPAIHQQNDVPLSVDTFSIASRTMLCIVKTADQCHYIERIHPRTQTHRADYSHLAHGTAWAEAS
jgi:hypothetical protein